MTRLDYNRASAQIALKVGADVAYVKNVIIWGNHSATQYPDATTDGYVLDQWGGKIPLSTTLKKETRWLQNDFLKTVQQRGKAIINARGKSSAMSAANAAADCIRTWLVTGTEEGETVGMAVYRCQMPERESQRTRELHFIIKNTGVFIYFSQYHMYVYVSIRFCCVS